MGTCDQYLEQISALLDGALDEGARRELLEHLEVCGDCRAYWEDQLALREALSALEAPAPEGFTARVMARIRAEDISEKPRKVVRFPAWRRWAALAACCAVVCLGVWGSGALKGAGAPAMNQQVRGDIALEVSPAEARMAEPAGGITGGAAEDKIEEEVMDDIMPAALEPDMESGMEPAAAPAAGYDGTALDTASLSGGGEEEGAAEKVLGRSMAQGRTLTAAGPTAQTWVEQELGQDWTPGAYYVLTEEEYTALTDLLLKAGEAFEEALEAGEGWYLLAEEPEALGNE